ncbi:hypothetical protein ACVINZ_004293 [Mesorhizobium jarvisii]
MMNYSDTSIAATTPFLSLESVRKTYPGVVALDGFSMEVRPGEVIGLVGEERRRQVDPDEDPRRRHHAGHRHDHRRWHRP